MQDNRLLTQEEKSPNQGNVSKSEKSLQIREKSPNHRKVSKSQKSLKTAKLIMLIPSKPV